GRGGASNYVRL
uniref:Extended FMRFamide-9 n=8 Tax=Mantophasmatodea TaxID=192413 RepID=FAR9_AUSGA|nr:RecName: Full=Extended FMRFamide-9; Short=FMRFa-9 [Namaquaphasma ookiepense]B0M3B3.1 RecName: Full=Extended FMRFamide-9; Short=FMRFa-9 [Striatophasma naukluftense]B0M8U7.1 RecName: Full=Extended FMRFamide-9; Short=FMRFa-9 [Karoophasma botterkloofense]B3A069.1 RecName: Full=Extended FMRFamide-9; Short=FMRFa-9 [Karoophasma biedouwense]B3A0A7.1 RecName: Full=Extended FMRFamide-9; Short=FMRFa-9 [Austrophasma rawsonvillense]B3A0C7.1 RecName: Full=Extended FMRFamide-9; Short=FMRFa-9 [Hemilobophas